MNNKRKIVISLIVIAVIAAAVITTVRMMSVNDHNFMTSSSMQEMSRSDGGVIGQGRDVAYSPIVGSVESDLGQDHLMMAQEDASVSEKKEIKNGEITMQVADADQSLEDIVSIAKEHGGHVHSSRFYRDSSNIKNGTVEVRVPVEKFEVVFGALKKIARVVVAESTYGQDVTLAYRDLQARLNNKKSEEQTFVRLLEQSGKLSDVIDVTREVSRVRSEIEQLQTQITYMESQTDYAVIMITMAEDQGIAISDQWRPVQLFKETVNSLMTDMQEFVNFFIIFMVRVVPIAIMYGLVVYMIYVVVKNIITRVRRRNNSDETISE